MTIATRTQINVQVDGQNKSCSYTYHPQHRDKTPTKSQWTITYDEESRSFCLSLENQWNDDKNGWGVHLINETISYLGISQNGMQNLLIAKYVCDNVHNDWHGYPANHIEYSRDIPPEKFLLDWKSKNYITSAKMRKILKGQPCNL
ncbi:MAG: hypothetical protein RIT27_1846 [Pseudomonadota bacterium]|jgi:hypothetical protein